MEHPLRLIDIAKRLRSDARHRAGKKDVPFDLPMEWFVNRLLHGRCEMTGIRFTIQGRSEGGWSGMHSPSVDRIDGRGGYTEDNCRLVVWHYNCAKSAYSDDDLLLLAEAIVDRRSCRYERQTPPDRGNPQKLLFDDQGTAPVESNGQHMGGFRIVSPESG